MSKMPRIGAVVLALLLVGCALPEEPADSADAATPAGMTSAPATEVGTTPATGSSSPATQARTAQPAVTVPQLPIGGGADDPVDVEQCVSVSFLGDALPSGIEIVPAAVSFSEPLFERGGGACSGGDTACLSGGFAFTAANDDTRDGICSVAVRAIGERSPDDFDDVQLTMTGRLDCPPGLEAACEVLAQELDADEQSIELTPPTAQTTAPGRRRERPERRGRPRGRRPPRRGVRRRSDPHGRRRLVPRAAVAAPPRPSQPRRA